MFCFILNFVAFGLNELKIKIDVLLYPEHSPSILKSPLTYADLR